MCHCLKQQLFVQTFIHHPHPYNPYLGAGSPPPSGGGEGEGQISHQKKDEPTKSD